MVVLNGLVRVEVKWPGTEQESRFVGVGGSVGIMPSVLGRDWPGCGLVAAYGQVRVSHNTNLNEFLWEVFPEYTRLHTLATPGSCGLRNPQAMCGTAGVLVAGQCSGSWPHGAAPTHAATVHHQAARSTCH
jgi:hypothetical protein